MGYVCDVEFDLENGRIESLIIPHKSGLFGMFIRNDEYVIPWKEIKKIGEDIIFVEFCL